MGSVLCVFLLLFELPRDIYFVLLNLRWRIRGNTTKLLSMCTLFDLWMSFFGERGGGGGRSDDVFVFSRKKIGSFFLSDLFSNKVEHFQIALLYQFLIFTHAHNLFFSVVAM